MHFLPMCSQFHDLALFCGLSGQHDTESKSKMSVLRVTSHLADGNISLLTHSLVPGEAAGPADVGVGHTGPTGGHYTGGLASIFTLAHLTPLLPGLRSLPGFEAGEVA